MRPNHAALGDSGLVRRGGLLLLLPVLALYTGLSGCKNPADSPGPVAPSVIGFTFSGLVLETAEDGGDGIGAVLVEITSGTHAGTQTTTDSAGAYSIPDLTGQLNVRYSRDGFVPTGRTVNMSQDTKLNVTLLRDDGPVPPDPGPTFTLFGVVREGQGNNDPIGGAVVEIVDGENAGDASTTDSDGRFSIPALSGEFTVRASRDGFDPVEETVDMTEDRRLVFRLMLPAQVSMCLDLDDEEVHITNDDEENKLVLTDWVLREAVDKNTFTFVQDIACRESMTGFTLEPGATVIITSGDDPSHSPPTHIAGWCDFVWDDAGDVARLINTAGNLVVKAVGSFDSCGG